jgi:hypothetical protein
LAGFQIFEPGGALNAVPILPRRRVERPRIDRAHRRHILCVAIFASGRRKRERQRARVCVVRVWIRATGTPATGLLSLSLTLWRVLRWCVLGGCLLRLRRIHRDRDHHAHHQT